MDLVERIEGARFLGAEFLLWVWFESERMDADSPADEDHRQRNERELFRPSGVDAFSLDVNPPLALESFFEVKERVTITGTEPSESAEARAALRDGKLPLRLKLEISRGERTWSCTVEAETLAMKSVRLPAELQKDDEGNLDERLYLMEELEQILDALLRDYVALRLSPRFDAEVRPAMHAWIHSEAGL